MALKILLAATLRSCLEGYDPMAGYELTIEEGLSVRELVRRLGLPEDQIKLVMVNGVVSKWDVMLQGNERVALFPPVGGG